MECPSYKNAGYCKPDLSRNCPNLHSSPASSFVLLIKNFCAQQHRQESGDLHFILSEILNCGNVTEFLIFEPNLAMVQFSEQQDASSACGRLGGRFFRERQLEVELSPLKKIQDALCTHHSPATGKDCPLIHPLREWKSTDSLPTTLDSESNIVEMITALTLQATLSNTEKTDSVSESKRRSRSPRRRDSRSPRKTRRSSRSRSPTKSRSRSTRSISKSKSRSRSRNRSFSRDGSHHDNNRHKGRKRSRRDKSSSHSRSHSSRRHK